MLQGRPTEIGFNMMKLSIFLILCGVSLGAEMDEDKVMRINVPRENLRGSGIEMLKLVRQRNSPRSQDRLLQEVSRHESEMESSRDQEDDKLVSDTLDYNEEVNDITFARALHLFKQGIDGPLVRIIESDGFDPNVLVDGFIPLISMAILDKNLRLVSILLKIPGIDVNLLDHSGFLPITLAMDYPDIFSKILNDAGDSLDLLKCNIFGENPIQQAIQEGKLMIADRMLRRLESTWFHRNEAECEEILNLRIELTEAFSEFKLQNRRIKIKTD